jgi:hypothetical protein
MSTEQEPRGEAKLAASPVKHLARRIRELRRTMALPGQPKVPWRPGPKK